MAVREQIIDGFDHATVIVGNDTGSTLPRRKEQTCMPCRAEDGATSAPMLSVSIRTPSTFSQRTSDFVVH